MSQNLCCCQQLKSYVFLLERQVYDLQNRVSKLENNFKSDDRFSSDQELDYYGF